MAASSTAFETPSTEKDIRDLINELSKSKPPLNTPENITKLTQCAEHAYNICRVISDLRFSDIIITQRIFDLLIQHAEHANKIWWGMFLYRCHFLHEAGRRKYKHLFERVGLGTPQLFFDWLIKDAPNAESLASGVCWFSVYTSDNLNTNYIELFTLGNINRLIQHPEHIKQITDFLEKLFQYNRRFITQENLDKIIDHPEWIPTTKILYSDWTSHIEKFDEKFKQPNIEEMQKTVSSATSKPGLFNRRPSDPPTPSCNMNQENLHTMTSTH
jgi:hypothetical protein